jgi:hypothetical protein
VKIKIYQLPNYVVFLKNSVFSLVQQLAQDMDLKHPQSVFFVFGEGTPTSFSRDDRQNYAF